MEETPLKLNSLQIESIIDRLVPLIAKPEDREFFRGVLWIKAENSSSGEFAYFVSRLLKSIKEKSDAKV